MSKKYALIIGNTEYIDPALAQLTAPGKDTEDFARVLRDQELCAFDQVKILLNQFSSIVIEAIDEFFDQKKPDDLLVVYFSGHGVRDELGSLYLAVSNTIRTRLRSTAIRSDYIREAMDQSRSKRQVLILDCCNSGAFPQGTKAEVGGPMGMTRAFQGYGRFVLTASDATQFAWEGNKVIGETDNSLFTHFLVKGLEGEADSDGDGTITVDELYDYTFQQIAQFTPNQTPTKSSSKQEGEIVLRQITDLKAVKAAPLPAALLDSIQNPFSEVRLGAVQQLITLLSGRNLGLARSARDSLERIAREDDSFRVRNAAKQALEADEQVSQENATAEVAMSPSIKEDNDRKSVKETPEKQLAPEKIQVEPKIVPKPPQLAAPLAVDQGIKPTFQEAGSKTGKEEVADSNPLLFRRNFLPLGISGLLLILALSIGGIYLRQRAASKLTPTVPATEQPISIPVATGSLTLTEPPTTEVLIPETGHSMIPANDVPKPTRYTNDTLSSGTGPEGRAPYGDSYKLNRLERPFLQENMIYIPDLDIDKFGISEDEDWYYVSIVLIGSNPNNSLGIAYGLEVDMNGDGFGDYIVWTHPPYTITWETSTVQVFKDSDRDTAGLRSNQSDAIFTGNGYDRLIFDGSSSENSDPDLAWVRMIEGQPATIQIAFKTTLTGSSFLYGVVADAGLKDVSKFDYNDRFTEAEAGSSVRDNENFPLGALYAVDNTCWEAKDLQNSGTAKLCPTIEQAKPTKKPGNDAPAGSPGSSGPTPTGPPPTPPPIGLRVDFWSV